MNINEIIEALHVQLAEATATCVRLQSAIDVLEAGVGEPPAPATVPARVVERARAIVPPRTVERSRTVAGGKGARLGDVGHAEVARIAREARAEDRSAGPAVAEHFGITEGAARQRILAAQRRGFDCGSTKPHRLGPIGKLPVNEDAARDAAGGPRMPADGNAMGFASRPAPTPTRPEPGLRFSIDDARNAIEGAS